MGTTTGRKTSTGSILLITRLARQIYRRSTDELLGIPLTDLAVLNLLRDHERAHGPMPQQTLNEQLCLHANAGVLALNKLEAAGYVERRRDPADRRRHMVALTPDGREVLSRAERGQASIEDDILAGLDAEQRHQLQLLLQRALDQL